MRHPVSTSPPVVVLVEGCDNLAHPLERALTAEGFRVSVIGDGQTAVERIPDLRPDLVILDLILPGMDGFEVLTRLRRHDPGLPVLVLTDLDEHWNRILGLRLGADDYVTRPFDILEVIVRMEAILRRSGRHPDFRHGSRRLRFGGIEIDRAARTVQRGGLAVELAPRAFDLLVALFERGGLTASRAELLRDVWGHRAPVATRTVDAHIVELRRKLEDVPARPRWILTVPKVGYRLAR